MMLSSSTRVLKSQSVNVDTENKILIDIGTPPENTLFHDDEDIDDANDANATNEKKARDAQATATSIIKQAERKGEQIINEALQTATERQQAIMEEAHAEADKILSQAREQGYKDGMDRATREGDAIIAKANQVLQDAQAERLHLQESLEPDIVNMVIGIAQKLLGDIAKLNPQAVLYLIKQGFAAGTANGEVTVYVSPTEYDAVIENKDELLALTDGSVKLEITKDLSLSPMDCVIETPIGGIDCSLDGQFESLKANLTYILNNR